MKCKMFSIRYQADGFQLILPLENKNKNQRNITLKTKKNDEQIISPRANVMLDAM